MRPQRTKRMIRALLGQTMPNWEAFVIGDCCPYYDQYIDLLSDPRIWSWNQHKNGGGWGYQITNLSIQHATGKYFMFLANDDMICKDHVENYLGEIDGTDLDFVYFDSFALGKHVSYKLKLGHVGDNAVIIRTEFLKQMPLREPVYNHDWHPDRNNDALWREILGKAITGLTYHIMSSPKERIDLEKTD